MKTQPKIVVIDDDPDMLRLVQTVLVGEGYFVETARDGTSGAGMALAEDVALVVLDLNLPDTDGIEIARLIRASSTVPILMLTGRADVAARVEGLDAGADDYLPKPFNFDELRARVRSQLRRGSMTPSAEESEENTPDSGRWRLDVADHSVVAANGNRVRLTEREFMILAVLIRRDGAIVSRNELQRQIAGREWDPEDRSLDVHVSHLRKKLREISESGDPIRTVRGKGFRFQAPES